MLDCEAAQSICRPFAGKIPASESVDYSSNDLIVD